MSPSSGAVVQPQPNSSVTKVAFDFVDFGGMADLAKIMIRDCKYDVSVDGCLHRRTTKRIFGSKRIHLAVL